MILIPVFFITGRLINLVINTKNNNTEWENYKKRISCTNKNSFFNLMKPITSNLFYGLVLVILGLLNLYKYSFFAILPFAIIIFLVYIMKLIVYTNNHHKLIKQYKNIKACLFDFDGTLVDDMMEFADLAGLTMNKFYNTGFEIARKRYIDITGIPFIQQIHAIYPGALKNDEANFFFETNKEELFFNEHIEEDVKETLIWLKNKGYKIAVSSGGFRDMMVEFCKRDNVDFDFILGYEKGFEKGPEHFSYLLKEFNIGKDELLFMGDSLKDGEKGINFGIKFIAKIGTFSKKAFKEKFNNILTVNRISELKKILHSSK
jgi:phosphoglycolate phosphatase-like HAD superfamily hydrolase